VGVLVMLVFWVLFWVLRVPYGLCAVLMVGVLVCAVVLGRVRRRVTKVSFDV